MSRLVEIKRYLDRQTADLDRAYLESCDLEPVVMADDAGGLRPHMSFGENVRLMIPEDQYFVAETLLNDPKIYNSIDLVTGDTSGEQSTAAIPVLDEDSLVVERAWKIALISVIILPIIGNLYSLFVLKRFLIRDAEKEISSENKVKIIWILGLNIFCLYGYWYLFKS